MSGENTKNYREQGGDRWVVDGELDVTGRLKLGGEQVKRIANQADSTAADVGDLVADFNDLLAKLKDAGLMEPDPEE